MLLLLRNYLRFLMITFLLNLFIPIDDFIEEGQKINYEGYEMDGVFKIWYSSL